MEPNYCRVNYKSAVAESHPMINPRHFIIDMTLLDFNEYGMLTPDAGIGYVLCAAVYITCSEPV